MSGEEMIQIQGCLWTLTTSLVCENVGLEGEGGEFMERWGQLGKIS